MQKVEYSENNRNKTTLTSLLMSHRNSSFANFHFRMFFPYCFNINIMLFINQKKVKFKNFTLNETWCTKIHV